MSQNSVCHNSYHSAHNVTATRQTPYRTMIFIRSVGV